MNLSHDHVLRRNIRITLKSANSSRTELSTFVDTVAFGSHHIYLVCEFVNEWNSFLEQVPSYYKGDLKALPVLRSAESGERFGLLVASASAFPVIKTEDSEFTGIEYAAPLTIEESVREDITSGLRLGSEDFRVALVDTDTLPAALQIQEGEPADLCNSFILLTVIS